MPPPPLPVGYGSSSPPGSHQSPTHGMPPPPPMPSQSYENGTSLGGDHRSGGLNHQESQQTDSNFDSDWSDEEVEFEICFWSVFCFCFACEAFGRLLGLKNGGGNGGGEIMGEGGGGERKANSCLNFQCACDKNEGVSIVKQLCGGSLG